MLRGGDSPFSFTIWRRFGRAVASAPHVLSRFVCGAGTRAGRGRLSLSVARGLFAPQFDDSMCFPLSQLFEHARSPLLHGASCHDDRRRKRR